MALKDKEKWDSRYRKKISDDTKHYSHHSLDAFLNSGLDKKNQSCPNAPQSLLDHQHYLINGTVLDVASGEGAVALYLAENSHYSVTAVDISPIGLSFLSAYAKDKKLSVNTIAIDLDNSDDINRLGVFKNITIFRYKPSMQQLKDLSKLLAVGGRLIISTFNLQHHLQTGFPKRLCLADNELIKFDDKLQLLSYTVADKLPSMSTYVFEKIGI